MTTRPLSDGQKLFLQKLMAAHVYSQEKAVEVFERLNDIRCASLEEWFSDINSQLSLGFGLEITTVSLQGQRHHAIVNKHADDVSKESFTGRLNPHFREFVRLVLQRLIEDDGGVGRIDLINIKNDLKRPYKLLTMDESEMLVDMLVDEKWLVCKTEDEQRTKRQDEYVIGPRTYMELPDFLQQLGLQDLPQMIFHRN